MFVKKGDKVRVIAGKDKGTEAVVLKALPKVKQSCCWKVLQSSKNTKNHQLKTLKVLSWKKKHQSTLQTFKFLTRTV